MLDGTFHTNLVSVADILRTLFLLVLLSDMIAKEELSSFNLMVKLVSEVRILMALRRGYIEFIANGLNCTKCDAIF